MSTQEQNNKINQALHKYLEYRAKYFQTNDRKHWNESEKWRNIYTTLVNQAKEQ